MQQCPDCKSIIPDNLTFCGFCGRSLSPPGNEEGDWFETWLGRVGASHGHLLASLRDNLPIFVLSSISLVIAGFVREESTGALGFALGAFVGFMVAGLSSLFIQMVEPRKEKRGEYVLVSIISLVIGFVFLVLVALALAKNTPYIFGLLLIPGLITMFTLLAGTFSSCWNEYSKLRRSGTISRRTRATFFVLVSIGVWGLVSMILMPILFFAGPSSFPFADFFYSIIMVGFLSMLISLFAWPFLLSRVERNMR